jgi:dimethylhistidine N-methyltransferase
VVLSSLEQNWAAPRSEFLEDLLSGFEKQQKAVPGKYLWDETGSALFDRICACEDYYPTHREEVLLRRHAHEIAKIVGPQASLIEYGSGASHKVRILLDTLAEPRSYVGIDISLDFLEAACSRIARDYPKLSVAPLHADYTKPIVLERASSSSPVLGFFPGTTIGNFDAAGAVGFLSRAKKTLGESWFLVGVDPNCDRDTLSRAYADRDGLMASLHENLIHRIARETDAD